MSTGSWHSHAFGWETSHVTPAERLRRVEALAELLDEAFTLPGTNYRVGLDGLLGLVPGIGDLVPSLMSLYIVYEGWQMGVSAGTIAQMLANITIDFLVGTVPVLGDLFDFAFKANKRNLNILRRQVQTGRVA